MSLVFNSEQFKNPVLQLFRIGPLNFLLDVQQLVSSGHTYFDYHQQSMLNLCKENCNFRKSWCHLLYLLVCFKMY